MSTVKKRWVCSTNFCKGCKAVIYTIDDVIVSIKNKHNHEQVVNRIIPSQTYESNFWRFIAFYTVVIMGPTTIS